ncbi:MAG: hypothetical protein WC371_05065, partial [Parachlamydiales bacterium]
MSLLGSLFGSLIDFDAKIVLEEETMLDGCVNVLNGAFYWVKEDLIVKGAEPLILKRFYHTIDTSDYAGGLEFFPHLLLKIEPNQIFAFGQEPSGASVRYSKAPKDFKKLKGSVSYIANFEKKPFEPRLTEGLLSGRVNYRNNYFTVKDLGKPNNTEIEFFCADGTLRHYRSVNEKKIFDRNVQNGNFHRFLLDREKKPNGNLVLYSYDDQQRLASIETHNPAGYQVYASLQFHYLGDKGSKSRDFSVTTSDGRKLNYRFWNPPSSHHAHNRFYFERLESSFEKEKWSYDSGYSNRHAERREKKYNYLDQMRAPLANHLFFPEGRAVQIDYYQPQKKKLKASDPVCGRVKTLWKPTAKGLVPAYELSYLLGKFDQAKEAFKNKNCVCHVKEYGGNQIFFNFSGDFYLSRIDYLTSSQLHHRTEFIWDEHKNLARKRYLNENQELLFERIFAYDGLKGNVLEETISGNLTGRNNSETFKNQHTYNEHHLPLSKEDENHFKITYEYLPGTDLIAKKFIFDRGRLLIRHFFLYDPDHICVCEITDDGSSPSIDNLTSVSERKITRIYPKKSHPAYNLPEIKEELALDLSSQREILLKKTKYSYSAKAEVIKEEIYDSNNKFRYAIATEYNSEGLAIKKSNPLGQIATFDYTFNEELKKEQPCGKKYQIKKTYDQAGNLILEEKIAGGLKHAFAYAYDHQGNLLAKTDQFGTETKYVYDHYRHPIEICHPRIFSSASQIFTPQEKIKYDVLGRKIETTDANGNVKKTTYNFYGKPLSILYPDGTKETFYYYKNGLLEQAVDQESNLTSYIYDALGRLTCKHIHAPDGRLLKEESHTYNAFHELSFRNAAGNLTAYSYDYAGRKIQEENNLEKTTYVYDALGRLFKEIKHNPEKNLTIIYERDLLDRVTEERKEDPEGRVLFKEAYQYGSDGNRTAATRFVQGKEQTERFFYDGFDRLIQKTDALGNSTKIEYDENFKNQLNQNVLRKTTIDPVGLITFETFDAFNRLASLEKFKEKRLLLHEKYYDGNGNLSEFLNTIFSQGKLVRQSLLKKTYDALNRQLSQIEDAKSASPKITLYSYTPKGFLEKIQKPDGVILFNTYDPLGRRITLASSDRSIHYAYTYDPLDYLLKATDLNTNQTTQRVLDDQGHLLEEKLASGYLLCSLYDRLGRKISLSSAAPFNLSLEYQYDALYLRKAIRKQGSSPLYEHDFLEYDLSGNLLKEKLISKAFLNYQIDPLSRRRTF